MARVAGVVTEKDGKPHRVGARLGVLVNAGGFALNQAMRDQYMPGSSIGHTSVAEGDTGEMIQEMMRHGAAIAQMDSFVGSQLCAAAGQRSLADQAGRARADRRAARDPRRPVGRRAI